MLEKYDYDLSPTPLQLECERLRKEAEIGKQMLGRMMSEYAELRDQLAEAKKDAERWKFYAGRVASRIGISLEQFTSAVTEKDAIEQEPTAVEVRHWSYMLEDKEQTK